MFFLNVAPWMMSGSNVHCPARRTPNNGVGMQIIPAVMPGVAEGTTHFVNEYQRAKHRSKAARWEINAGKNSSDARQH
jgi:hypothetical protein